MASNAENVSIWWRHHVETFSVLLALGMGNSAVTGEFLAQRPVTRNFNVFVDFHLNKRWSKHSSRRWFETSSRPLWRHYNVNENYFHKWFINVLRTAHLFHWLTNIILILWGHFLFTYKNKFWNLHHQKICGNDQSNYYYYFFFNTHWHSFIPKRECLVGAGHIRCGESGTPSLGWRHKERDSVSYHRRLDCLLNGSPNRPISKKLGLKTILLISFRST